MKLVIGIDYGTQSARAVLTDAMTGETLAIASRSYPHGILPGDLVSAQDYDTVLQELLGELCTPSYAPYVRGICVDATSYTMVPLDASGRPLSYQKGLEDHPHAQIKLWKRHTAQRQADEALRLAKETHQPFLGRSGGTVSCEWALPKIMEIFDEAPELLDETDLCLDLCDYLTYSLTGIPARSAGAMGFKCLWARDLGLPDAAYLDALRPGLAAVYHRLMRGEVYRPGEAVGNIRPDWAEKFGLSPDVKVATGVLDGHTVLVAVGALEAGDAVLVVGTSNVLSVHTSVLRDIIGICGIAQDGLIAGLYGIDAGQCGSGDMLDWFVKHSVPEAVTQEAKARGISVHDLLCSRIRDPWKNDLIAVDWFNGSRNAPCDLSLTGAIVGMKLTTAPEDIYLAMLQGIASGTREIVDLCESYGVPVSHVRAMGGITVKNPTLMQQYADILNRRIEVGAYAQGPALGSAIFASVACGIHPDLKAAHSHMGVRDFIVYEPDPLHREEYEALYLRGHRLREHLIAFHAEK